MDRKYKIMCPKQYDRLISAELPNKKKYPVLYKMVTKHMMHGPCGLLAIVHAQRVMIPTRTVTLDLSMMSQYKARTHIQFIDGVKMAEKKKFADTSLTTDGS